MDKINTEKKDPNKENEIDLILVARTLWNRRINILRIIIVFGILGLFVAIFSRKEYSASTTMVPQINNQSAKLGGLSSLASIAGFNLDMNMGSNEISPMLYPQILNSITFQLEIMNSEYSFEEFEEEKTLYAYYIDHYKPGVFTNIKNYTVGLPNLILKNIRKEQASPVIDSETGVIRISKEQEEVRKIIQDQLSLNVNDKDGYLKLVSRFHQPELSAQVAQKAQDLLQDYITRFKIEKAKAEFLFIEERYLEAKEGFENSQARLATFRDANKNISSAIVQAEEQKLENEYQLAYEVYSELAKQLEQARIKVKEETPVFLVIEEVVVPIEKSKPRRGMIIILWLLFGGIFGIVLTLGNNFLKSINPPD
jgi:uncharacterized protein involved in exopolysaccharide biosynthesis